jgi:ASC-1-like (ASCH) protein
MAIIKKKIWPKYFELISSGKKRFELRLADFDIKEEDTLILEEWNPETKEYTGRTIEKKIDYISKFNLDFFGQEQEVKDKGIFIIQFEE